MKRKECATEKHDFVDIVDKIILTPGGEAEEIYLYSLCTRCHNRYKTLHGGLLYNGNLFGKVKPAVNIYVQRNGADCFDKPRFDLEIDIFGMLRSADL